MKGLTTLSASVALVAMTSFALADEYKVSELVVKKDLKAGQPYTAALAYEKSGEPKIIEACYLWSGEGPYCFKARDNKGNGQFESRLRTNNPGRYRLEGFIKYKVGNKTLESNHASSTIIVKR